MGSIGLRADKVGLGDGHRKYFEIKQQLASGVDLHEGVTNGRIFKSVALDWYASMVPKWAHGPGENVTRLRSAKRSE